MNILASNMTNISLSDAGILAGLGYGMVFVGLIALMVVVILIGKVFTRKTAAPAAVKPTPAAPVAAVAPIPSTSSAPGSAGHLKIHNIPPKTAAMLMAIVADKMGKPLNELRFISIKEVK